MGLYSIFYHRCFVKHPQFAMIEVYVYTFIYAFACFLFSPWKYIWNWIFFLTLLLIFFTKEFTTNCICIIFYQMNDKNYNLSIISTLLMVAPSCTSFLSVCAKMKTHISWAIQWPAKRIHFTNRYLKYVFSHTFKLMCMELVHIFSPCCLTCAQTQSFSPN